MKAMALTGIREIKIIDKPVPEPVNSWDVLIRVKSVGICGSDIHYYNEGNIGNQVVKFPFTLGHECSGIVEYTAKAVKRVKPGDRIAIDPAMPCYNCFQCKQGRYNTCLNLKFLGCPGQAEGCLTEFIVMPEKSCFPINRKMGFDVATLSEPLSIGLYATELAGSLAGKNIGILGAGPIGISVLLMSRFKKASKIYMTDLIDERLSVARSFGADWTGNTGKENIIESITTKEPELLDVIFECCGKQEAVDQAIKLLKPGGSLVIAGIPAFSEWKFRAEDIRRKELTIKNVRRQNEMLLPTLELLSEGLIRPEKMITHIFTLDQVADAFEMVAGYRNGVMKAMVHI
ncbi:MAG: zinc-dependent alcohol dehydrogenase [Bacteroidales bacterium]